MTSTAAQPYEVLDAHVVGDDKQRDLRAFYLLPQETYSLAELARLWRVALDDVCAIFSDALATAQHDESDSGAFRVTWADAVGAATAHHVYRAIEVEQALGDDFERVRPGRWRTVPVVLHVPLFIIEALEHMAIVPSVNSMAARAERLLCETVEAECILQLRARSYRSRNS